MSVPLPPRHTTPAFVVTDRALREAYEAVLHAENLLELAGCASEAATLRRARRRAEIAGEIVPEPLAHV